MPIVGEKYRITVRILYPFLCETTPLCAIFFHLNPFGGGGLYTDIPPLAVCSVPPVHFSCDLQLHNIGLAALIWHVSSNEVQPTSY